MTFNDVAIRNFRTHLRQYLSYFICSTFAIIIFFMYSTLIFNDKLRNSKDIAEDTVKVLAIPGVALVIFSVFFISYTHSAFIKSRQKEFGLFMSLGMSNSKVIKVILIENSIIGLASVTIGIITGIIFSRLFFFIVLKVLGVNNIVFELPFKSIFVTAGIFIIIFFVAIFISSIKAYRFQPVQLIKNTRISERNKISSPALGMIGIIVMLASIMLMYKYFTSSKPIDTKTLIELTFGCLAGLYIALSQIGGFLLKLTKKNKGLYYKNLRFITGLDYRFRQTKKIVFVMTIMIMMTSFYCGFMVYFLSNAEKQAIENNPYDVSYVEMSDRNNISESELDRLLSDSKTDLTYKKSFEFILLKRIMFNNETEELRTIVPAGQFNKVTGENLKVQEGFYIRLYQYNQIGNTLKESFEKDNSREATQLKVNDKIINLRYQHSIYKVCFNNLQAFGDSFMIVNDNDYNEVRNYVDSSKIAKLHMINFKDWHNTDGVVRSLEGRLHTNTLGLGNEELYKDFFKVSSKIEYYKEQKQEGSILLFISGFVSLFFFISGSVILSFRLFTEIDEEKAKYRKLYKIGIKDREIKNTIYQELGITFFLPVVIGAALAFVYIFAFTADGTTRKEPLICNLCISGIYLLFQIIYYLFLRRYYSGKIIESLSGV